MSNFKSAQRKREKNVMCKWPGPSNWRIINYFYRLFLLPFTNTFQLIPIEKALSMREGKKAQFRGLKFFFVIRFVAFTNKRRFFLEENHQRK